MTPDPHLRWLRAAAVGGISALLGVVAHSAGGAVVDPLLAGLVTAALIIAGHRFVSRPRGFLSIAGFVLLAQAGLHVLLGAGHPAASGPGMTAAHAVAAVLLAAFLRFAERSVHDAAVRRYVRWRAALAGLQPDTLPPRSSGVMPNVAWALRDWPDRRGAGRGPP